MKARLKVFRGNEEEPLCEGILEGDPVEILDVQQQLNLRWPGRRAEIEVVKEEPAPA